MRIAIPKEITHGENRVALVPTLVSKITQLGCQVIMEKGAALNAHFRDEDYSGVEFVDNPQSLYQQADIILKVECPEVAEIQQYKKNAIVIGMLSPGRYPDRIEAMSAGHITSFALENIPRISRAQAMDALSSQATIAGYKAALLAANFLPRFFPMLTTAAGTIRPATVLVIGAGVAGLQAIATAHRLGAIVKAYDIRPAAREQVESLGAKMINIDIHAEGSGGYARELTNEEKQKQADALANAVKEADAVITTALIPGRPAPKIITKAMVEAMKPGSVIIDIAAIAGGNCELTQADTTVTHQGVTINGPVNLPSMLPKDASIMYAKNVVSFLALLIKDGNISLDWADPILSQSALTHEGKMLQKAN